MNRELGMVVTTSSNLKNIATALEMWAADNEGQYPSSLDELVGNYLKRVPQQANGSRDWNYRADGSTFSLSDSYAGFKALGIPEQMSYSSEKGISATAIPAELQVFPANMKVPGRWLDRRSGNGLSVTWERFGSRFSARLCGPETPDETFEQMTERVKTRYITWGLWGVPRSPLLAVREGHREALALRGSRLWPDVTALP